MRDFQEGMSIAFYIVVILVPVLVFGLGVDKIVVEKSYYKEYQAAQSELDELHKARDVQCPQVKCGNNGLDVMMMGLSVLFLVVAMALFFHNSTKNDKLTQRESDIYSKERELDRLIAEYTVKTRGRK